MSERAQQSRAVERRAAILEAARELLHAEGMQAVSHRRVAEVAGVPSSSVGYYFSTREDLLVRCLEADEEVRAQATREALEGAHPGLAPAEIGARVIRTIWGDTPEGIVGRVGAALDGVRESPLLHERMRSSRPGMDEDLRTLLIACGYPAAHAPLVLHVANGSIVSSGVEGYADQAFDRAAADVGELLTALGR